MALLFSKVNLFNGESEAEFLTMGIPRDYEDIERYTAFEEYLGDLSDECDIEVNVDSYLYGDGETWTRPASMWFDVVIHDYKLVTRFTYVGE